LVPGAYYSDITCGFFRELEEAMHRSPIAEHELSMLTEELELILPCSSDDAVEAAYKRTSEQMRLGSLRRDSVGPRMALRMLVTIANAQLHATPRESGLRKLAPSIAGLFDPLPKGSKGAKGGSSET
jgi:hypothetical protein